MSTLINSDNADFHTYIGKINDKDIIIILI